MNALLNVPKEQKKSRKPSLPSVGRLDFSLNHNTAIKYVPYFIFLTLLGVLYISNNYYSDRTIRKINQLDKEVEVLRVDYSTLKYEYIYSSKQSEIAQKVKQLGLIENDRPAYKIEVPKTE